MLTIEEIPTTTDMKALAEVLEHTQNMLFAAQNFRSGQMFLDAKYLQSIALKRAKELTQH